MRGMLVVERRQSQPLPPKPDFTASLRLCSGGVALGKGTIVAALAETGDASLRLALEGRDQHIIALLSVAQTNSLDRISSTNSKRPRAP
jgi:hypothetical protein